MRYNNNKSHECTNLNSCIRGFYRLQYGIYIY